MISSASNASLSVSVLTLFPEMFPGPLGLSLAGKALSKGIWRLHTIDIRSFSLDKHKTVDDKPCGGGTGMVMRADILGLAIDHAKDASSHNNIIYMSPRGKPLTQAKVRELAQKKNLIILCGRFEGIDERVIEEYDIEEISMGDFILSGGEIAALSLIDACIRLLPGVIEKDSALIEESFGENCYSNLLEYPQYTRPTTWKNRSVPEILLSGNHSAINKWRLKQAEELTKERRKDLWENYIKTISNNKS